MEPCRFLSILPFPFPFFRFPPFSFYPHFRPFPPYPLCPLLTSMSRESPPTDPSGYHCEFSAGPGKARPISSFVVHSELKMTPRVIAPLALRHDVSQKRSVVWSTASCMTKEVPVRYARAGIVYSVSRWTRGVQVKLWDPLRTHAIPERLRGWSRQGAIQIHVIPYHTVWLLPVHAVPLQALLLNCSLSLHSSLGCWIIMTV